MDKVDEVLERGVKQVLPDKKGLASLMRKRKICLYLGIDPTGARLHLGHSVALRKLAQFAELGHEAILLFGTGTVLAGDPSQREEARQKIAAEQIDHNISSWKDQVKSIVDFNKVNIMYNGEWLLRLTLRDIIEIASNISAVHLFKREMFQKRIERGDTVWTHEVLYPLLQGYDSVAMDVDLEIGGTDQTFNMLIGRELLQKMKGKEKYVLTTPMIMGTDGQPMSKTRQNAVWLNDEPVEMFGKLMSIPDDQIIPYMELASNMPLDKVRRVEKSLSSGKINPMEAKKELAFAVTSELHSRKEAEKAQAHFERVHQKGELPEDMETIGVESETVDLVELLVDRGIVPSKSEVRRLIDQGGIRINDEPVSNTELHIHKDGMVVKIGKRRFFRLKRS